MKTISFGDTIKEKISICLGYFDGIHCGHEMLFEKAKEISKNSGGKTAVFTFENSFSKTVKGGNCIFSFNERMKIFEKFGVDYCIIASVSKEFLEKSSTEFLNDLFSTYSISSVICGEDYTFGFKGLGNSKTLEDYSKNVNVPVHVMPVKFDSGVKISSSLIKKHIELGEMETVSKLLGYDYFLTGEVVHGANIGEKMGFPTLNIVFAEEKCCLRRGVYKTQVEIDGVIYNSITNFGTAPTFDRLNLVVETYVLNFNRSIYGKTVTVFFKSFVRGLIRFNSMEELIMQIKEDVKIYD